MDEKNREIKVQNPKNPQKFQKNHIKGRFSGKDHRKYSNALGKDPAEHNNKMDFQPAYAYHNLEWHFDKGFQIYHPSNWHPNDTDFEPVSFPLCNNRSNRSNQLF